jgi:hypothetical protein
MAENVDIPIQAGEAPNWGATLLAGLLFGLIAWFYFIAMQPRFKGGVFVTVILGMLVAGQLVILMRELWQLGRTLKSRTQGGGAAVTHPTGARSFAYKVIALILLFGALIYMLCIYVGAIFFLFTYLFFFSRQSLLRSVAMTAGIAALGLCALSYIVSVPLWVGVAPTLIPGFVGGAISPVW